MRFLDHDVVNAHGNVLLLIEPLVRSSVVRTHSKYPDARPATELFANAQQNEGL
jgi:hypothetical protein